MKKFIFVFSVLFFSGVYGVNAQNNVFSSSKKADITNKVPLVVKTVTPSPVVPSMAPVVDAGVKKENTNDNKPVPALNTNTSTNKSSIEEPKNETIWDKVDKWIGFTTRLLLSILVVIGIILGWTIGNTWKKNQRLQKILSYADKAFPMVESLAKKTAWKGDDKLVQFLKRISDWLKAEGDYELNPEEVLVLKKEAADRAAELKSNNTNAKIDESVVTRS